MTDASLTCRPVFRGRCLDPGTLGFQLPFDSFASAAAVAGFDHIEVPVGCLRDLGPDSVRRTLHSHRLNGTVFSCPWELPANGSVSTYAFARRLASLPRVFDGIAAAGGRKVSAFFAGNRPGMVKLSRSELADRCASLTGMARGSGLEFCVELNDVSVLRDCAPMLRDIAGLRLLFDTFHYFRAGLSTGWFAELPQSAIGWVHLSDVPEGATPTDEGSPRAWPGLGQQNTAAILSGLAANGYTGPLSLEILPAPQPGINHATYAADLRSQTQRALDNAGATWTPSA